MTILFDPEKDLVVQSFFQFIALKSDTFPWLVSVVPFPYGTKLELTGSCFHCLGHMSGASSQLFSLMRVPSGFKPDLAGSLG